MNLDVDILKFISHGNIGSYAIEFDSGGIYFANLNIVSAILLYLNKVHMFSLTIFNCNKKS